jgi:DNA-binding NarL/FixJ family response regulator
VTRRVIEHMARPPRPDARLDELTPREREVLALVARGLSNAEIATAFVVEESTVKTHVKHILRQLGARDRVRPCIVAHEAGLARGR